MWAFQGKVETEAPSGYFASRLRRGGVRVRLERESAPVGICQFRKSHRLGNNVDLSSAKSESISITCADISFPRLAPNSGSSSCYPDGCVAARPFV